jgi:hypothetical protein
MPKALAEFDRTVKRKDCHAHPQGCARAGRLDAVVNNRQILILHPFRRLSLQASPTPLYSGGHNATEGGHGLMRPSRIMRTSPKTTAFQFAIAVGARGPALARSIRPRVIRPEREVLLTLRLRGSRAAPPLGTNTHVRISLADWRRG